jgi:hypothetical protein
MPALEGNMRPRATAEPGSTVRGFSTVGVAENVRAPERRLRGKRG